MRNILILRTIFTLLPVLACMFLLLPSPYAFEMASKRDCVVCHIMWLDDFRTDQDTLVEFEPGNVLMKDTQGVVSSEEICYSCHDGYVQDSRFLVWKYKRHKTFVKPSKNVSIPDELPLSVKNELYCGTCHSAHGKGAAPHGDPMGRTSVFREVNINSSLCEMCHIKQKSFKTSNGHPVHSAGIALPERLFQLGGKKATQKNEIICQSCHMVHGARGDKILITDNKNSQLCVICHENKKTLFSTKHDLSVAHPEAKNIKQQSITESGPCGACHTPHNAAGDKLWARRLQKGNPATEMCNSCHSDNSQFSIKKTGDNSHPVNVGLPLKMNLPSKIPLFADDGTKNRSGKVQCFTCHDVHRWDPTSDSNRGGKETEGDSTNSFLRIGNASSELCVECHADKKSLMKSDHNLSVTAPEEKNVQGFTAKASGPCGVCHIPHNASAKHLWARTLKGDHDFVTELCSSCHNENGAAKDKLIGENYHPVDVKLDKLHIATTLPLFDGEGNRIEDGKIVCITCHEPHIWSPSGSIGNYNNKNMEGDARNSFLRAVNFPSSDLCKSCHVEQALVDGTDHDLNVTSPESKNLLGQTVKESGQCGVCHLVHNSKNKIKLWARELGEVHPDEDIIDALCNSCHSKGNIAEAKIPPIATHPTDKLINNIMRCDRTEIDYAPIFDRHTGDETNVGNISCPTCHNAHKWSPLLKENGNNQNMEGTTTNSFLRNVSHNNICIDCHGLEALFRYKYFHDLEERKE